jgi:hypothetical protein
VRCCTPYNAISAILPEIRLHFEIMDLIESLGLGTKQPEDNIVYFAVYSDDIKEGVLQRVLKILTMQTLWHAIGLPQESSTRLKYDPRIGCPMPRSPAHSPYTLSC